MKIIKYIFFLIVLAAISLTVFIATQNSSYTIIKTKEINLPKRTVYNYIEDLENTEQWQVFSEDSPNFILDSITKGKNASINWKKYKLVNTDIFPYDSLTQEFNDNDTKSTLKWILKSSNKGTTLTLKVDGKMDFVTKFKSFFLGGIEKINGPIFEKTLNNINHHLIEEYKKFEVNNEKIVFINEMNYIQQIISTSTDNLSEKIFETMKNMKLFCKDNNLKINGDPFIVFQNIDVNSKIVNYAVCLPITTEIFTSEGSDITGQKSESFYAYKTTLNGDYSHSDKAWNKNRKGINENNLTIKWNIKPISVFKKSKLDSNKPSEWITEFLTPVNEIVIPEVPKDSLVITE